MKLMADKVYFLGIGGIGMSALARYFRMKGWSVAGYDRTPTPLTAALEKDGIAVDYTDAAERIPEEFRAPDTLVVYTPAIPADSPEKNWFSSNGFKLHKRAEVLGLLSSRGKALCVAGTHGKTTTTTLLAYLLERSEVGCNAFLGGISRNYNTNLLLDEKSEYIVVEADEYDRSFLHLTPYIAAITAMDDDHMDIYGTRESMLDAFAQYASQVCSGGCIIVRKDLETDVRFRSMPVAVETYGVERQDAGYYAKNLRIEEGRYIFDYVSRDFIIDDLCLGIPGRMNVENAVLAITMALKSGVSADEIRSALPGFAGVVRRFNIHAVSGRDVYADDYAHHPEEIKATLNVAREMYSDRLLTVVFQPHLYTRTRDLCEGFAESLSLADRVILTDIYPAREEPIPGVSSEMILERLNTAGVLVPKENLLKYLDSNFEGGVLITLGAGNIDALVPGIAEWMKNR